ncbi:DHHW family protein [Clostridium sp. LIBA-8841]|uniref:DHHW family protein n=1 Tax=Clostridium sp. LIBA-8841 TaxID=2987530 RepID=UPI002AC44504|nr:DHHW family protein [Clostridium sp. LIBA-8841]MDZ5252193.1 DHHW family protein [Clostridium sp. LIBA-8841]
MSNMNKHKKIYTRILALVFIISIFGIFFMNMFSKDKNFSEEENRMLAKKPKFSIDRLVEGRYTEKYEKYVEDQFTLRNSWIGIKSTVDRFLGKKEENGVFLGKDDYLIEDFKKPEEKNLQETIKAMNNFSEKYKGINQYALIAPNSVSVLKDKLPKNAPVEDQKAYIEELKSSLNSNIKFIDIYNTLESHKDEYIYYRTDHHWTTLGAYYAFLDAAKEMGLTPKENYYDIETVTDEFYGTLYSKSGFKGIEPDSIDVYIPKDENDEVVVSYEEEKKKSGSIYNSEKLNEKDKYEVFLEGNHPLVKINTLTDNNKKLLLIKDSYANSFVQFLTPYFNEIVIVDPRYYYEDIDKLISEEGITDLLYLYNANTFFSDNNLAPVLNNE